MPRALTFPGHYGIMTASRTEIEQEKAEREMQEERAF
jgi:hypothetical protein